MTAVRVVGIQADTVWHDPAANHARLAPRIAAAAGDGARLVLLPEMYACGFSMRTDITAEAPDGPSATFLVDQAAANGCWVGGTFPELTDGRERPTNTFLLAGPDGQQARYAKIHPFTYAGEDEHFAAGDTHVVIDVDGLRCALFVCYDLRFADEFWALATDVDCYLVPANWPEARREHWMSLLVARAIENQAWVVGVNRVGFGRRLDGSPLSYSGDSLVVDPLGEVVARGGTTEANVAADVTSERVADVRSRFPFLQDRR